MTKLTPMMEQYVAQKADAPDALLFFRLGDFYELFMDDALLASRELDITLTGREAGEQGRVPMCGVPVHAAESYIARLIAKQYKVAICEQDETFVGKGIMPRRIVRVITPGTVLHDSDDATTETRELGTLVLGTEEQAIVTVDCRTGQLRCAVYRDLASVADGIYAGTSVVEWIVDEAEQRWLEQLPGWRANRALMTRRGTCAVVGSWLQQQFPQLSSDAMATLSVVAQQGVMRIARYIDETQKQSMPHIRLVEWSTVVDKTDRSARSEDVPLGLDAFTRHNLELVASVRDRSRAGSLLGVLDKTSTAMGGRLLRRWIEKPLTHHGAIVARHDAVDVFVSQSLLRVSLVEALRTVYDIERLIGRLANQVVSPKDLDALWRTLRVVPVIQDQLHRAHAGNSATELHIMIDQLDACSDVCDAIERALHEDVATYGGRAWPKDAPVIREGYDERLDQLRTASQDGKRWIAQLEQREREATGIRSLKVGYTKVFGYYIEVTHAHAHAVPTSRYERKQTLANAERYVTAELKQKEALILEASEQLDVHEQQLFQQLCRSVAQHIPRLQTLATHLARLDALLSLATVAVERRYVRPHMHTGYDMRIVAGRHPVVETMNDSFMPNDTVLNPDHVRMWLITGPNMAGKSTYMRQVALITIMAQLGSFVPAREAQLPIVDHVFTRIGASDDLVGGQSTFMVEMRDIQQMLSQATQHSLIIIDELGRGTASHEGMAIAQAVMEHIHDHIRCKTLVSTHYHELARLTDVLTALVNGRMDVQEDGERVLFLKKLVPGAAASSYGIYCAQNAGLPHTVIARAYALLQEGMTATQRMEVVVAPHSDVTDDRDRERERTPSPVFPWIEALRTQDLSHMSPFEALRFLYDAQKQMFAQESGSAPVVSSSE